MDDVDAHRAGMRLTEVELDLEHRATGKTAPGFIHRAATTGFPTCLSGPTARLAPAEAESSRWYARQQHQDRSDDADDRRKAECDADHVHERSDYHGISIPIILVSLPPLVLTSVVPRPTNTHQS